MESIKSALKRWLPAGSLGRWLLSVLYANPIAFPFCLFRSLKSTRKLTGKFLPLVIRVGPSQTLDVHCASNANVVIDGIIRVNPWGGSRLTSTISIGERAALSVLGDFEIGPDVHILVTESASLRLGGQRLSTASGITSNSRIMVEKSVEIGADCIIAWDVIISDSNWHDIKGIARSESITIGDNVWIAHGVSVVKGAQVPSGCIVGAESLFTRGAFPENSLLAGVPATVRRTGVEWPR